MKWSTWVLRNKVKALNQASALVILDSESFNLWNKGECSKSAISSSIENTIFWQGRKGLRKRGQYHSLQWPGQGAGQKDSQRFGLEYS
jgi:hypothetical protein